MVSIASCGGDSSPTGASQGASSGSSFGGAKSASNGTTVAEILANPNAFLGQPVELQGTATERFSTGELLFTDATGSIPAERTRSVARRASTAFPALDGPADVAA
jgi:uncharacterized protein YdeI (BOF family)